MFIFFHPETRVVHHIVTLHPANYGDWLTENPPPGEIWVETPENYSFDEIEILEDHSVRRRQPMTLTHPETAQVGVEFIVAGVPENARVIVNGAEIGVMDESETLEFTAGTGGVYRFRFEGSGYITKEIVIEALG